VTVSFNLKLESFVHLNVFILWAISGQLILLHFSFMLNDFIYV